MNVGQSHLTSFLFVAIIIIALPLTVFVLQQQQQIQQHAATVSTVPMSPPPGYGQLIFDDTFSGTALSTSRWVPQMADTIGIWCDTTIPCPYSFVGRTLNAEYGNPDQVVVNNGLTLNATRDNKFSEYTWKAGYVTTYKKFTFDHGYVQVKARMPDSTTGAWASIWFVQARGSKEIDLQESGTLCSASNVNTCMASNLHTSGNNQIKVNTGMDLSAGYHIYGMEYKPGQSITMYLDGKKVAQYTANIPTGSYDIILTETLAKNASSWHSVVSSATPSPLSPYQIAEVQVWQQCAGNCPSPTPTPGSENSGEAIPVGDIAGWHQIFLDDFTKDAPIGSWGTNDAGKVVYTGDHGGKWVTYPDGWKSTYTGSHVGYMPSQVLSVHDGMLDWYLHTVGGYPASANPSPVLPTGSPYQTYGRYSIRMKVVYDDSTKLADYYSALLLWPQKDSDYTFAESDFPEGGLANNRFCAYAHYAGVGSQDSFCTSVDITQWHTYTQEWGPGFRKYYIDGNLIGTSTKSVWQSPERWQLQIEDSGKVTGGSGHVLVDWVVVYAPANPASQVLFSLSVCPHGLGNCGDAANPSSKGNVHIMHKTRHVTVTVTDANGKQIAQQGGPVIYNDTTQTFQGSVVVSDISSGIYTVAVKMDGYLSKQVSVSVVSGQPVSLPPLAVVTGDMNNDNQINILDYNVLISCFGNKFTTSSCLAPATTQNSGADIDDDGIVDGVDYNLFLREFRMQ